ncbi:MAG: Maf family protein [Halothiobacillus sp.]
MPIFSPAPLFLASSSPRRAQLLTDLGFEFTVWDAQSCAVDETPMFNEHPLQLVARLAQAKAMCALNSPNLPADAVVLAGDTVVVHAGHILGKPRDRDDALAMLEQLNGNTHRVSTAIAVANTARCRVVSVTTNVTLMPLTAQQIRAYVATGEPLDKAGAYALQGKAAQFVQHIDGSWGAVVGLPQCETAHLLAEFSILPTWLKPLSFEN